MGGDGDASQAYSEPGNQPVHLVEFPRFTAQTQIHTNKLNGDSARSSRRRAQVQLPGLIVSNVTLEVDGLMCTRDWA